MGCPLTTYIKEWRRGEGRPSYDAPWRSPTPTGTRIPPSLVGLGEKEGGEREEGKGGAAHLPSTIQTRGGGGARPALAAYLSLHESPLGPIYSPGGFGNPPVLWYMAELTRNLSDVQT